MSNFIIPFVIGIFMYILIAGCVRIPGAILSQKFANVGTLSGLSGDEIISKVGSPTSTSSTVDAEGNPVIIRQWLKTGYHIALMFDTNDICLGVTHEASV